MSCRSTQRRNFLRCATDRRAAVRTCGRPGWAALSDANWWMVLGMESPIRQTDSTGKVRMYTESCYLPLRH